MHNLMHGRHDSLPHHGGVEAEHNTRVRLQLQKHLGVARPPVVLILLKLEVTPVTAVFLISAEEDCAAHIDQDEDLILALDFSVDCFQGNQEVWVLDKQLSDRHLELSKLTITCEGTRELGPVDGILLSQVHSEGE